MDRIEITKKLAQQAKRAYIRTGNEDWLPAKAGQLKSPRLTKEFETEFNRFTPRKA